MAAIPRHPYVAIGQNGLVKVGMAVDVKKRQAQLRKEFRAKGDELASLESCDKIACAHSVEWQLIFHCREHYTQHSGREWFTGADFRTVVDLARKLTNEMRGRLPFVWTEEDRAQAAVRSAERREQRQIEIEARKAWKAARRMRRNKSERVISAIVSFVVGNSPQQAV